MTRLFWEELVDLCDWAFTDQGAYLIQELSDREAWVFQLENDVGLSLWRASLSLDGRWTLSPVY